MSEQTSQSIGTIRCERELREDLFLGCIELPEQQERRCVIHFLSGGDDIGRRRFVREAMIGFDVSRDHKNLLSTLFFGVWDDGRLFVAVECVEGRAVSEVIEQLRGRFDAIRSIAAAVLQALAFLHERGVAHGQVIGSNILVGVDGVVRLGNFSRARRVPAGSGDTTAFQADLRALGELLFELVADIQLSQIQLFVDAAPRACLPAETTPELVSLIEYLLAEDTELSAAAALASLRGGEAPALLGDGESARHELALMAGDLETAQALLPPATEIDVDIDSDDELSGAESEEQLALLFASMLNRLNGEREPEPEPELVAQLPAAPPMVVPPPPPSRHMEVTLGVSVLALMVASFSVWRGYEPDDGIRPSTYAQLDRRGASNGTALATEWTTELAIDEQGRQLPAGESPERFTSRTPAQSDTAWDLAIASRPDEQNRSDLDVPESDSSDEFGAELTVTPVAEAADSSASKLTEERPKWTAEKPRVDGISQKRRAGQRAPQSQLKPDDKYGTARYDMLPGRAHGNQSVFLGRTTSSSHGLHFVLESGVLEAGRLRLFGSLYNRGDTDFQVAEFSLHGQSEQTGGTFTVERRANKCTADSTVLSGAKCKFYFESSELQLSPDKPLFLVVRDRSGMRRAVLTIYEES